MEKFLTDIGLEDAIPTFSKNRVKFHHFHSLTEREIEQLLPLIGDRQDLKIAIKTLTSKPERLRPRAVSPDEEEDHEDGKSKLKKKKQDNGTKIIILLKDETRRSDLLNLAEQTLKTFNVDLFEEKRRSTPGWHLINVDTGKLNCPFCEIPIRPQTRNDKKCSWILGNLKRHLEDVHPELKCAEITMDENGSGGDTLLDGTGDPNNTTKNLRGVLRVDRSARLGDATLTYQNDTNLINPRGTTTVVVSQGTKKKIKLQKVPAIEQLSLENDLNAVSDTLLVNTNEISIPKHHENEVAPSMIAKRISAVALALDERHRIAREETEKPAEFKHQQKVSPKIAEQQRIIEGEENQRLEEETLRLEEQEKTKELHLLPVIEEAKQREEEERQTKEQEEIEREKLKIETAEKLQKEEKEREESRVEEEMSRTRKGGGTPENTSNKDVNADQLSPSNSDNDLVKTGTNENNLTQKNNVNMATYEMYVTNEENALINSFSNLIENQSHPTLNIKEFNAQNAKTNGKSDIDATNDGNSIIKNAINGNGHTDHSLDNILDSKNYSAVDNKMDCRQEGKEATITAQLNDRKRPSDSSTSNDAKRYNCNENSQSSLSSSVSHSDPQNVAPKSTKSSEAEANNATNSILLQTSCAIKHGHMFDL